MEKIEKKTERTIVDTRIIYKAIDGTEFDTESECKRYEATAKAVFISRLQDCIICIDCNEELFECCGEGEFKALVPTTHEHLDAMNQLYKLYGGKSCDKALFNEEDLNTLIFMCYCFCNYDIEWLWFYKASSIIEKCTDGKWTVAPVSK